MELNGEECISELDTKIKYAKFANTNAVVLSSKAAQFCLEHAQYYEQKIKELTEENERLRDSASSKCEDCAGCTSWKCDCANIEAQAKADTVKKMQERLIAEFRKDDRMNYYLRKTLEQIAKEMLGQKDE